MNARAFTTISVEQTPVAAVITLNRPERRNAIGPQMVNELIYALTDAFASDAVRYVVITGAGKAFCAGGDLSQMSGTSTAQELPFKGDYADVLRLLARAPKPIIARVNGDAMGGGLGLVAASTFAVAVEHARLGTPEIKVGLFPMMIMALLGRQIPRRRLVEMMVLGQRLTASEALSVGLLNRCVVADALDATVEELGQAIANKSPHTLRLGLEAFADQDDLSLEDALPLLRDRLGLCLSSEDAAEGLAAFMEKRPPQWKGR